MSGFEEYIVREYFERHGFLVRQIRRAQGGPRRKHTEENLDLLIFNPGYAPSDRSPAFYLFKTELAYLERAVVIPKAWHKSVRFDASLLRSSAELFRFIEKHVGKELEAFREGSEWASNDIQYILVLPGLPTSEPYRSQSIDLLRALGVDGILSFRAMLLDVIGALEAGRQYEKSPFLQILGVLRTYDLLKEPQLGLFKDEAQ